MSRREIEGRLLRELEEAGLNYEHARAKCRRTLEIARQFIEERRLFLIELALHRRNDAWNAYEMALKRYNDHVFDRPLARRFAG